MAWLFKFVGMVILALAVIAAGAQMISGTEETSLGGIWFSAHNGSLNLTQAVIQRYIHPALWDPMLQWVLTTGTPLGLAMTGFVTFVVGRIFIQGTTKQDAPEEEA